MAGHSARPRLEPEVRLRQQSRERRKPGPGGPSRERPQRDWREWKWRERVTKRFSLAPLEHGFSQHLILKCFTFREPASIRVPHAFPAIFGLFSPGFRQLKSGDLAHAVGPPLSARGRTGESE